MIGQTAEEFIDKEVLPALDRLEAEGLGAGADARAALRRAGPAGDRRAGGLRRPRSRQGLVGRRRRGGRPVRVVRDDVRRADGTRDHADPLLRHRGTEAEVPAAPGDGRDHRRLCAQRVRIRIRRARRARQGDAAAGRQLRPHRREDVDHQRRLRRRLHRLRQGRRRALHAPSSSSAASPASAPGRRSTSSGCWDPRRRR